MTTDVAYWETFYQKSEKPSKYDNNIKSVENFISYHENRNLVLVSVSQQYYLIFFYLCCI